MQEYIELLSAAISLIPVVIFLLIIMGNICSFFFPQKIRRKIKAFPLKRKGFTQGEFVIPPVRLKIVSAIGFCLFYTFFLWGPFYQIFHVRSLLVMTVFSLSLLLSLLAFTVFVGAHYAIAAVDEKYVYIASLNPFVVFKISRKSFRSDSLSQTRLINFFYSPTSSKRYTILFNPLELIGKTEEL